jgi:hypothetical protein
MWFIELIVALFTRDNPKEHRYRDRYIRKIKENKEIGL